MKKLTASLLAVMFLVGCKTAPQVSDTQITLASALAARITFTLIGPSHQKAVAGYMYFISTDLYALTDAPTPDGLTQIILNSIPASDLARYPEIKTLVIPAISDTYKAYFNQYAANQSKLIQVLKDIASGLQSIAAQYK